MALIANPFLRKLAWTITTIIVLILAGEVVFVIAEELIDLIIDATQTVLMALLQRAFDMPHDKAQGRAAWISLGLLVLLLGFAGWRLGPVIRRSLHQLRQEYDDTRQLARQRWQAARWYEKILAVTALVALLSGLLLVI